jgi:hypothetical protein
MGGHVGHQEGTGQPRRRAHEGGDPIQFKTAESDFEFSSECGTTTVLGEKIDCSAIRYS